MLPFLARDPKAIKIVQVILGGILLQWKKNMADSEGKNIVELPPKEVCHVYLDRAHDECLVRLHWKYLGLLL